MSAKERVDDLIALSGRLADVLAQENDALRARKPAVVVSLLDHKLALCRAYENRCKLIDEAPTSLNGAGAEGRNRLKGLGETIHGLMEENAVLLRAAIEAHRRIMDVIGEAVRSSKAAANTYSRTGVAGVASRRPEAAPLTLDRSL